MSYNRIERLVFPDEDLVAIVAAMPSGSRVILAPGTHTLSNTLVIASKSNFALEGQPGAVLTYAGTDYAIRVDASGGSASYIVLKNFSIRTSDSVGKGIHVLADSGNLDKVVISGVHLTIEGNTSSAHGIFATASTARSLTRLTIQDCIFDMQATPQAILVGWTSGSPLIRDVSILRNRMSIGGTINDWSVSLFGDYSSVPINYIENIIISGNQIRGNHTGVNLTAVRHVVFSNNVINSTVLGAGVQAFYGQNVVIKSNTLHGCSINCWYTSYLIICGNTMCFPYWAIYFASCSMCVIADNNIQDPQSDGILLQPSTNTDIAITGNYLYRSSPGDTGIYIGDARRVNIFGGGIYGFYRGIDLWNCEDISITGVTINTTFFEGIRTNSSAVRLAIKKCTITPATIGIYARSDYVQIVGNFINGGSGDGIFVYDGDYVQVNGNVVRNVSGRGIRIGMDGYSVDNSQVNDNEVYGCTSSGIWMDDSDETQVCGNRCYNNGQYGITEDATCDQCLYGANHLRGNTAGATNFNGTNRTEAGNKT